MTQYRMDEHVDPPFHVGPRALEIYRERLGVQEGVHGQYESAVLQAVHYAYNEGLAARPQGIPMTTDPLQEPDGNPS